MMRKVVFAAGLLLAMVRGSCAQDFNPGTVVGNVFQNPLSGCGYGYGLGCDPPSYGLPDKAGLVRHHHVRRRIKHDVAAQH
jgi:hypothetical protein